MNRRLVPFLAVALFLLHPATAPAALRLPQASAAAAVERALGITDIRVEYHSPGVKDRKIWGDLVPYDQVWRLGANDATTIHFSTPVTLAGHALEAGTYALFAIPGEKRWTIIVNSDWQQWGAFFYKPEHDLFRVELTPERGDKVEWMRFDIEPTGPETARVQFAWDRLRWSLNVQAEVNRLVWAEIDSALAGPGADDWEVLNQAARYSMETGERTDQAFGWIDKAMTIKESFWNQDVKARLLHRAGRNDEAIQLIGEAMNLATGKAPAAYIDGLEKTRQEWEKERK